ncbi:MAG: NAD(P)-dependent oxidoreductase [Clostridia bacterium]
MRTVAFVGLGVMGRPMAGHLAKAGFDVKTYDIKAKGNCASLREAASGAHFLVTMLPDGKAVRRVVLASLPHLAKNALVVDTSSSDPEDIRGLSKKIDLVDAPVSGAVVGARAASLTFMVGGTKENFRRARPLLAAMGKQIFHVGPVGAGDVVKALNNYLGAVGTLAGFEALLIARAFRLDPLPMLAAINASTGRNSTTAVKIARDILPRAYASGFKLALMAKDVAIARRLAAEAGVHAPFLRTTLAMWRRAQAALPRAADHSEIYKYQAALARGAGAPARRRASSRPRRARRKSVPGSRG